MKKNTALFGLMAICTLFGLGLNAEAQTGSISAVAPDTAEQGSSDLTVTITLSDEPSPPPDDVLPNSVMIGSLSSLSMSRPSQYELTAVFDIPSDEEIGAKDVTVIFQPPTGDPLVYSVAGGFSVTAMPDTAPVITRQPQSQAIRIGNSVTLTLAVYGSSPLEYQWQKDDIDITGATAKAFTIEEFAQSDAGSYQCTVNNDFGNETSDVAELTVNTSTLTYPIVDTNQILCYNNYKQIDYPAEGEAFYGQDAQYTGTSPSYNDNGDGTITDNVTGLMWAQEQSRYTMEWSAASPYCESLTTGGYTDWRLPTVKELWSIRDFSTGWPWVDTTCFYLSGDGTDNGQHHSWSCNLYLIESEYQNEQVIGDPAWVVNDWTGHIKAMSGRRFVRAVRGTTTYGINDFVDNGDGTVTDNATGLMWSQDDNAEAINWEMALAYADAATIAGYDDWRLPNIKELQSIVDYSAEVIPAMDTSVFNLTELTNVVYDTDTGAEIDTQVTYPAYWSSTSNPIVDEDATEGGNTYAWLLVVGYNPDTDGYDLHGAGSVVFDTKAEEVSDGTDFEVIYHYARLVRDVDGTPESAAADWILYD